MSSSITIWGLNELTRKLETQPVYAGPWRKALDDARQITEDRAKKRAPIKTGELKSSINSIMHAAPVPLYAKVQINPMPTNEGFRYGGALEGGKKKGGRFAYVKGKRGGKTAEFHYSAKGPKPGKPTRRWFRGSLPTRIIRKLLDRAAQEIEQAWRT